MNDNNNLESHIYNLVIKYKIEINVFYKIDYIIAVLDNKYDISIIKNESIDLLINEIEEKCRVLSKNKQKQVVEIFKEVEERSKKAMLPNNLFKKTDI
jgi:hypothetical protein